MKTRAGMVCRGPADAGHATTDLYDERHRQTKALARWERQKAAWMRMQTHLVTTTGSSSAAGKGGNRKLSSTAATSHRSAASGSAGASPARNFTGATPAARAKREDFGILAVAQPEVIKDGSHAWEGLLRCTDTRSARRLVPIGRTSFPYQLYSEARDPTTLPEDHMIYTRVVSEGDVTAGQDTTVEFHRFVDSTMQRVEQRAAAQSRVRAALTAATPDDSEIGTESKGTYVVGQHERGSGGVFYYEARLRHVAPYVQERLGHFLQPRAFLHVDGHPAPCASAEELEAQKHEWTAAGPSSAPPVEYYPPPPQTQLWASIPTSAAPSRLASTVKPADSMRQRKGLSTVAASRAHSHGASTPATLKNHGCRADGEDALAEEGDREMEDLLSGSVATATPSELPYDSSVGLIDSSVREKCSRTMYAAPTSPLHPLQVNKHGISLRHQQSCTAVSEDLEEVMQTSGPVMELSTRSLLFQTCPHELVQGTVTLHNTGTTTIYFSWVPVDSVEEWLGQLERDSRDAAADIEEAESGEEEEEDECKRRRQLQSDRDGTAATRITHSLAAHQRTARDSFFFLSSPMSGVVLPDEEGTFAFSVRANRVGLFQHTYELLTVPPAPERIFVRLRALVQNDGPSLEWLAAPVAEAIEAKVVLDAQRRLVQRISVDVDAIEGSALSAHIKALDGAAEAATAAERIRRRAQEEAWNLANRFTFDHIPYTAAVYDKLERLYTVVQDTCRTLGRQKNAEADEASQESAVAVAASFLNARVKPSGLYASLPAPVSPPKQEPAAPTTDIVETVSDPGQWDGSLLILLQLMMAVRDAPTRQTFFAAFLVLLRAARASQQCSSRSGSIECLDQETLPLPALLVRASTLLADSVQSRRAAMLERECENMLGQKLATAATPFMQAFAAASGAFASRGAATARDTGGASPSGSTAHRPQSIHSKKRATLTCGRSGTAAAGDHVGGAAATDVLAPAATKVTKAQRMVLDSISEEELLHFSAIQAPPKSVAALERAEKVALHAQRSLALAAERSAWIELYTALFLEAVDAACGRGPLSACAAARLAELEDIQTSALLPIDLSTDPIIPLTTGKGGKRK
ncbi:putative MYCBP-associated protein family [Leishmania utingensis]|uniref:MYCBP-associated protein family n=1 Tax=Leishmania utingensis TaxID=653362 RepID=A0AAW3AVW7_9TRYP